MNDPVSIGNVRFLEFLKFIFFFESCLEIQNFFSLRTVEEATLFLK